MTTPTWDIVIAGGGLSGLGLAMELSGPEFAHLKILILEKRTHYERDRTWSFWHQGPHALDHLERARWALWRVANQGDEVVCQSGHTYRSVDSDTFYAHALEKINACPHLEIRLGTSVTHIQPGWPCQLSLENSETLHTSLLIDARPPPAQSNELAQHFLGWEIQTDTDVFNPAVVELMDFKPTESGVNFFYVLPYSTRRALVECTWISGPEVKPAYTEQLTQYIAQRYHQPTYQKVFEERASLGLGAMTTHAPTHPGIIRVGRAAGTLRSSTGFAYLETLAHCAVLAKQLSQCEFPLNEHQPILQRFQRASVDRWMDKIFLQTLSNHWQQAPGIFLDLFEKTPTDALIRFLTGQATWHDRFKVMSSLPKRIFLKTLLKKDFLMSRMALFFRHSREDGNPSGLAHRGSFCVATRLASMDSRLHRNNVGATAKPHAPNTKNY
jgi:lycopene beta-cyclase